MTINEFARQEREFYDLTRDQLAELSGVSKTTIKRFEQGDVNMKYYLVEKILKALDLKLQIVRRNK